MPQPTSRVDLHCHSSASQLSKLGVQRALGLPECATSPEEVYSLAKRRGMDFVTITDHDTIAGVLEIADRPDVFVSEELTARFRGEPQSVHILCHGITPDDHDALQARADDVEAVAAYLDEREIACALAHPFFAVAAPLLPRHRRRLAELFPVWETRNGARARELNAPAAVYIETHGGTGLGGSDDHAGIDIGRTYTETPAAGSVDQLLGHLRNGRATARGQQGSAAKWAHAAMALAARSLGDRAGPAPAPNPVAVLKMVQRVVGEGDVRAGALGADLGPDDARSLLEAWLRSVGLDLRGRELIEYLQTEEFDHGDLFRRARRRHERALQVAVDRALTSASAGEELAAAALGLFEACVPAIPYAPAVAFLGREKAKLVARESEPARVALVADAIGGMHGVTHTLDEIRERGVPGFEVEVVGTDPHVDRRLSAVAEVDIPFYPGLKVGVPSLPALVEALAEGRYDAIHVCSPGPAGIAAALVARVLELPLVTSYHTELGAYAGLRTGAAGMQSNMNLVLAAFYNACDAVLSPSAAADASVRALGVPAERIARWDRGVDLTRFGPERRTERHDGLVHVLYAGRLTREKGVDLLAEAFEAARRRDPRLHLVLAGGGPEEETLRTRLGEQATFLGWLEGDELARAYASADLFLFASRTDTFGQVLLEAAASGLPAVAVAEGGPTELIADGVTGRLCAPSADALATAVCELAAEPALRRRLGRDAALGARRWTWEAALDRLGGGYRRALSGGTGAEIRRAA